MKKFLSLTMALAMTVAMVPATAFAKSDMKISRTVSAESDDYLFDGTKIAGDVSRVAPYLTLTVDGAFKDQEQTFRLKLTNAEWIDESEANHSFQEIFDGKITVVDADNGGGSLVGAATNSATAAEKALADAIKALNSSDATTGITVSSSEIQEAFDIVVGNGYLKENGTAGVKPDGDPADDQDVADAVVSIIDNAALQALFASTVADDITLSTQIKALIKDATDAMTANMVEKYAQEKDSAGTIPPASKNTFQDLIDAAKEDAEELVSDYNDAAMPLAGGLTAPISLKMVTDAVDAEIANGQTTADAITAVVAIGVAPFLDKTTDPTSAPDVKTAITALYGAQKDLSDSKARQSAADYKINKAIKDINAKRPGSSGGSTITLTTEQAKTKYNELNGDKVKFVEFLKTEGVAIADQTNIFNLTKAYVDALAGGGGSTSDAGVKIEKITDTLAMVTISPTRNLPDNAEVTIPLYTKLTGGETATVEVDPRDSEFSSDSKTFAKIAEGATETYTDGVKNFYDGDTLKTIYIDEVTANTFELNKDITVKLSSGFKWGGSQADIEKALGIFNAPAGTKISNVKFKAGDNEFTFQLSGETTKNPATIKMSGLLVKEDGADFGTTCKVTVSGAGLTKKTIEVGTYADFGLTLTAESKALPVIYAGSYDDDNETLKVTFEETVQNSWITDRKTELVLPEGVKFLEVDVKKTENITYPKDTKDLQQIMEDNIDGNKITIPAGMIDVPTGKKAKFEAVFSITADPAFTGDVELKVEGPGVGNESISKTVATVNSPLTVKSSVNEVKIDYRNVDVNAITITEAEAGLWEKGDKITLEVDEMKFESGIKAEIVSGDMKLEKLDGDYVEVDKKAGTITIQVKSTSSTTPAEIKIDGIKLYLDRSLPAGDYELSVVSTKDGKGAISYNQKEKDLLFANYKDETSDWDTDSYGEVSFETDSVTVLKDFVKVVTAGRDQDDSTFTTKITVPVGSDKIMAGTQEITIDSPAYINADGYTMLPVRAVIDALNGVAVVRWDDSTKTCTISFGSRIFAMTVGSKTMNMNGVATALLAAPEIKNERIFLPLRDLGYALGLTDAKINWDAATNTATLN